jgi:hypothetical protein
MIPRLRGRLFRPICSSFGALPFGRFTSALISISAEQFSMYISGSQIEQQALRPQESESQQERRMRLPSPYRSWVEGVKRASQGKCCLNISSTFGDRLYPTLPPCDHEPSAHHARASTKGLFASVTLRFRLDFTGSSGRFRCASQAQRSGDYTPCALLFGLGHGAVGTIHCFQVYVPGKAVQTYHPKARAPQAEAAEWHLTAELLQATVLRPSAPALRLHTPGVLLPPVLLVAHRLVRLGGVEGEVSVSVCYRSTSAPDRRLAPRPSFFSIFSWCQAWLMHVFATTNDR